MSKKLAAVIGGGVIGAGWAARFLLHGWDVCVFDPDPNVPEQLTQTLEHANVFVPQLYEQPLPVMGELSFATSLQQSCAQAHWVQECLPENIELKRAVLGEVLDFVSPATVVASSTSGFTPTALFSELANAKQCLVCHPYNPVYLIPLVEVVASPVINDEIIGLAQTILLSIGMKPVIVRREIDAHIGDRLLEAVWREALWLVKDGVATTQEIDDVIRFGFGPRWAQMGLFETYRIAGGNAGMAHFIEQFGPALQWPWSKLTDVPELDDELVQKIASQSDAQSGAYSIAELAQIRDQNLVAIFQGLKATNYAVGAHLNQLDEKASQTQDPGSSA